jgi:hypothetical protein
MTRYFCTYFDHNYLPRGLALFRSLERYCPGFELWVLCMDRSCFEALTTLALPGIHAIALDDFEKGDNDLLAAKQNRSPIEYYFTCSPSLPLFVLNNHPQVDLITYLDADLFFFAELKPIYDELADRSIGIIGHRFPPFLKDNEQYGIYNVGWLTFRRDAHGLACLRWWRERCLEWCYDRSEDGRFADQKYLDVWPSRFEKVAVLQHKGANLAPWNLANYTISTDGDQVRVDEQPLIFFHFHGLKHIGRWAYDPSLDVYRAKATTVIRRNVYAPYIRALAETTRHLPLSIRGTAPRGLLRSLGVRRPRRRLELVRGILERRYVVVLNRWAL